MENLRFFICGMDAGVKIWTMREFRVEESWVKMYNINADCDPIDYLKPICKRKESEEILVETRDGDFVMYNHENGVANEFEIHGAPRCS